MPIEKWLGEARQRANLEELGVIPLHNGIVMGASRSGKPVRGIKLSYNREKLDSLILNLKQKLVIAED